MAAEKRAAARPLGGPAVRRAEQWRSPARKARAATDQSPVVNRLLQWESRREERL